MQVRLLFPDQAAGLKDPFTKRSPFLDPMTGAVVLEADVPETSHWVRRVLDGTLERTEQAPTGREPVTPITTR